MKTRPIQKTPERNIMSACDTHTHTHTFLLCGQDAQFKQSDQKKRPSEEEAPDKEQLLSSPEVRHNEKHT